MSSDVCPRALAFRREHAREGPRAASAWFVMTSKAPAAVKATVMNFDHPPGLRLKTPLASDRLCIYDWGARIEFEDERKTHVGWIYMVDWSCRGAPCRLGEHPR